MRHAGRRLHLLVRAVVRHHAGLEAQPGLKEHRLVQLDGAARVGVVEALEVQHEDLRGWLVVGGFSCVSWGLEVGVGGGEGVKHGAKGAEWGMARHGLRALAVAAGVAAPAVAGGRPLCGGGWRARLLHN